MEILSPMGGCMVSCVGGLVDRLDDGWGLFNHYLDKIEIIQLSLVSCYKYRTKQICCD